MPFLPLSIALLFATLGYSSAAYCVCNSAMSDSVLQKNIDYACGNGADCGPISPNGPCFNPNTVKDHCNYAVNSYYQKKGQTPINCDFTGSAAVVQSPPAGANSACFSSTSTPTTPGTLTPPPGTGTGVGTPPPGTGTGVGTPPPGTGTGMGTPPPGTGIGTPGMGTGTPGTGTGTPGTGTGFGTPGTGTGFGTPGTGTGFGTPGTGTGVGLGPTGINGDNSGSISIHRMTNLLTPASFLALVYIWFRLI